MAGWGSPLFCVLCKLHLASTWRRVAPSETRFRGIGGRASQQARSVDDNRGTACENEKTIL